MVFIVVLARTPPHAPGREQSFEWNSPSVSIKLIWLIINLLLRRHGLSLSLSLSPSLSLSLSLVLPLQCVPSFVGWSDKGKGGWQRGGGKRECFLLVLGCFPTMFSLIPLHNSFSWSCPLPFAIHTCEQWILVTAQLARPSRLAPDVHHCAGEVAV